MQTDELDARGASRRAWVPRAVVALAVGLLIVIHLLVPDGAAGQATYLGVIVTAGLAAVIGARRRTGVTRRAWCWIAGGTALSALGDLSFYLYTLVRNVEPDISVADVPWLASYVALSVGLFMLIRVAGKGERRDIDGMIDMAVVGVISLLVVWQVVVHTTLSDGSVEPGVRAVWASYPILDAVLLALVVRVATNRRTQSFGTVLLAVGVTCWLGSDFFYMLYPSSVGVGAWLDAGWMAGAGLMAAATWERSSSQRPLRAGRTHDWVGPSRIALAIAPLLLPGLLEVLGHQSGNDPDPVPLFFASLALAGLAYARAYRLLHSARVATHELDSTERLYRALVQQSADAALVLDETGIIRYVSTAATDQTGYLPEDLLGRSGWDLIHPDDLPHAVTAFADLAPGTHARTELRVLDASGAWRWVEEVVTNLFEEPAVKGLVVNVRDIAGRKAAEQELVKIAHYDSLTGLPNRWLITEEVDHARAEERVIALLVLNLDHFKYVNQSRGRATGDAVLLAVVERLRAGLPAAATLGRLDGDEFAIVCPDVADWRAGNEQAQRIQQLLADPFDLVDRGRFHVTASIGIALGRGAESAERLLQQADTAMYAAKDKGRATSVVYDDQLRREADERITVENDLRRALRSNELIVHYQPVINLVTGTTDSVEALVRWRHPTRGLLMPAAFIPIAEHSSLIDGIGAFVLRRACADAAYWSHLGFAIPVAVNISAAQLCHEHVAETIRSALHENDLAPELLILEVTETALMVGAELALANVKAFRSLGLRVALDDFGTGYSSLAYLKAVPSDIVKIDRSFVEGVAESPVDRDIVKAIIDLAQALGRDLVAEGVETEAQLAALRRLGCPYAQGFLWSPAVPADAILDRVREPLPTTPAPVA